MDALNKIYARKFGDGKILNEEIGEDGKYTVYTTDAEGKNQLVGKPANFDEFKDSIAQLFSE